MAKAKPKTAPKRAPRRRGIRCPVCTGRGEKVRDDVHKCGTCEVLFRNPRPSAGALLQERDARFTGALTANHAHAIRESAQTALDAMRGYHRATSGKDAALNAFGKHVLDVGCGLGFRLRECEKYGWTVTGLESSPAALAYTQATALNAVHGPLDAIPPGPFDLILLEDVLGEIPEPKKFVAALKKSLTRTGVVCVCIPDNEGNELPGDQFYRFAEESARRLFMQNGFAAPETVNGDAVRMWFPLKGRK